MFLKKFDIFFFLTILSNYNCIATTNGASGECGPFATTHAILVRMGHEAGCE